MAELIGAIIERKRGDDAPDKITVDFDNTGLTYVLTINTDKDPDPGPPRGVELVSSTGIVGGADGTVLFPFAPADADQVPGNYWYDIEQTDVAGKKKTIAKNQYIYHMDVSK